MSAEPGASRFRSEIGEQAQVAARLLEATPPTAAEIATAIRRAQPAGILIAARGSSDHAALYAKYLFQHRNRLLVALAAPSLFTHYRTPPRLERFCVIGISQSGASPDVAAVVAEARRQGAVTVALTNVEDSALASTAEHVLPLLAGTERSVPASKTYTASLLGLALVSQALDPDPEFESALGRVPAAIDSVLEREQATTAFLPWLTQSKAVVLGRGFNLATAEELALKLTETSYLMARAWSIADFLHGPVAIAEPALPVVVISAGGRLGGDSATAAATLAERGCSVLELCDGVASSSHACAAIRIDSGLPEVLTPLPLAVAGQLVAHGVAALRRLDPDRPRKLRKVTRTW